MNTRQTPPEFSFENYLVWEDGQLERHEYLRGKTIARTESTQRHTTVCGNLGVAFKNHLRGTFCRAFIVDMKLRVEAADAGFYPDMMVSCDRRDHGGELVFLSHAVLVVEVLSDSTAAYDRGDKFADYRKLPSLQEYVIVDIDARRVECFRRNAENHWVLYDFVGEESCEFSSIELTIPLALVFEDVEGE